MATPLCTKRLTRELHALRKNPIKSPNIVAVPNESNILEWHYVIEGNAETPYEGGFYHGKLLFPKEYPYKPPSVIMLTPSGRFKPNRRLCLSMSDFHPESWNPMWSISTILTGLYSFMIETNPTLGSIETTAAQKRALAKQSLEFNSRDKNFQKLFPEYVELHEEREKERKEKAIAAGETVEVSKSSSTIVADPQNDMKGIFGIAAGFVTFMSILFALRFF